ncbi:MAG: acyl-CoA/acyl-ACP dehydrogenase [Armatimonadetes bacterium]|nr:acyl-CoA/acyl-ACP dehydrogenase [Armatimonadota bacterium]
MLERALTLLRDQIAPRAEEIDADPAVLAWALKLLGDNELMALRRPHAFGGPEMSEADFRSFQEEVARASGTLAFLQTQHQSAVSLVSKGHNQAIKEEYLPKMHNGERLVGIGFSQLRRPGPPILRAQPTDGGYHLIGEVPWVTGLGYFPEFLVGAQLDSGESVFGLLPFEEAEGICIGPVMELAAMQSANSVAIELDCFLPGERVIDIKPANWIFRNDMINITLQGFFAVGCARAGIDQVRLAEGKRKNLAGKGFADALEAELMECRSRLSTAQTMSEETTEEKLSLRAWAIDLAVRCAHAGIVAVGGSANSLRHPAQRIYREALVFSVSAQTGPIQEATLQRLIRR